MSGKKKVTLLIVPDDNEPPKRFRMPIWLYRSVLAFACLVLVAPVIYAAVYYEVLARAAESGRLLEENESLRKYQYKVQILEQSLLDTRQVMAQIAEMAGLDSVLLTDLYRDSGLSLGDDSYRYPGSLSRTLPPSSPIPDGLPATGFISRGFSEIAGKKHEGIDIALAEGSPVYSTAFGVVKTMGDDPIYGEMVVIRNDDSIETVYGHNSAILVQEGDTVFAGQRIALSGNTGKSSAPHLHYEIRIHNKAINPMKFFVHEN